MTEFIISVVVAVLGSGGLFTLIQYLIKSRDEKKGEIKKINDRLDGITKKLVQSEQNQIRLQMLFMIQLHPDEVNEILTLAQHYFKELHSNWYMTTIFNKWLEKSHIAEPEWFTEVEK